jgi:hypothetical protein
MPRHPPYTLNSLLSYIFEQVSALENPQFQTLENSITLLFYSHQIVYAKPINPIQDLVTHINPLQLRQQLKRKIERRHQ